MMISREHRFVFIEVPNTGSTALATELRDSYGAERLLHKHAGMGEFLRTDEGRSGKYFVFATVRHPLDAAVTQYFKVKTNHKGRFTSEKLRNTPSVTARHVEWFEFVQQGAEFDAFFARFYTGVYNNNYLLLHHRMNNVMRFEHLQEHFSRVLSQVGVRQVRPIPVVNPTGQKKRDFWSFYTPAIRRQAMLNYWPFMRRWGYAFPDEWGRPPASALAELKFATVDRGASLAALLGGLGPNSRVPWAVGVRDTIRRLWS